jgi:cellulose biosynthesis protein BcsQ/tetratricopeptide (TPR) repeat protein
MTLTPPNRRVITFYSFKGGVGRTMTMANVAYRLANKHGLRVIAVDWDLEAPGLHRFFGVSPKKAAKAHGVLDYFAEWREAVKRRDPGPPSVKGWILPITDKKHKPKFGSLSLLLAGKIDEGYDGRLAALNWQEFYAKGAGASAVETLREQLAGMADVVLIDSRTGFTDAGGICTIQIPDGVVLMTAPNQQSLEGIDRVARGIAKAPKEARNGRDKPRMWLVTSRVPMVEETYLAEQWFEANEPWFTAGIKGGLWLKEDHPEGLQSHKIPHRGRWGFDEIVLNEASSVDPSDLLIAPYEQLTETLARWLRGEPPRSIDAYKSPSGKSTSLSDIRALETEIVDAEKRGDILGMGVSLRNLAYALGTAGRRNEAIRKAEQACGIFLSRGSRADYGHSLDVLGWLLHMSKRNGEAVETLTKALEVARELGRRVAEADILRGLADAKFGKGLKREALKLLTTGYIILMTLDEAELPPSVAWLYGNLFARLRRQKEAVEAMRHSLHLARIREDLADEKDALESLIELSDAGENLPDADALRARLAELKAAPPAST